MTSKDHPSATITPPKPTPGQSGRFGSEQVVAFSRNRWPLSSECAVKTFLQKILDITPVRGYDAKHRTRLGLLNLSCGR